MARKYRLTTPAAAPDLTTEASSNAGRPPFAGTPGGKLALLVELLAKPDGSTVDELVAATGWQAHSVRGAISGQLKKKHGLTVTSAKVDAVRRYSIPVAAA